MHDGSTDTDSRCHGGAPHGCHSVLGPRQRHGRRQRRRFRRDRGGLRAGHAQPAARLRQGRQLEDLRRPARPRRRPEAATGPGEGPARGRRRRPDLHLHPARGREVQRRRAADPRRRRLHVRHDPRREDQQHLPQRTGRHRGRAGGRQRQGGLHPQVPVRALRRANGAAHRPRPRGGRAGPQHRLLQHRADRHRPLSARLLEQGREADLQGQPRLLGRCAEGRQGDHGDRQGRRRAGHPAALRRPRRSGPAAQPRRHLQERRGEEDVRRDDVRLPRGHPPQANEVTGDRAVRRALDAAVDRRAMVDEILDGVGRPAYGPLPLDDPWFAQGIQREQDLAEARRILDQAGWRSSEGASAPGTGGGRRSPCCTPPATRSARTTPSRTPPTPRRPGSR